MMNDVSCRVESRAEECPGVVRLGLSCGTPAGEAVPGQFLMVEASSGAFPVSRRPFTISRVDGVRGVMEIVFEVVGRGTEALARVEPGDSLRVLGPLGRGFRISGSRWLLIGGGLGAAGFPFLAARIPSAAVILGASCSSRLIPTGMEASVATEDGSAGTKGLVTDLLAGVDWGSYDGIAVCGPAAMMKAVVEMVPPEILRAVQVSMESRMGCGWGACGGCAVPSSAGGYLKCCTDGPVFDATEIDWTRMDGSLT
jgi:dihydroorotate dehydrogenase electron transfer subunit